MAGERRGKGRGAVETSGIWDRVRRDKILSVSVYITYIYNVFAYQILKTKPFLAEMTDIEKLIDFLYIEDLS